MWVGNQKTTKSVYLVIAAMLIAGCNNKTFFDANKDDINKVPFTLENPDSPTPDNDGVVLNDDINSTKSEPTKPDSNKIDEPANNDSVIPQPTLPPINPSKPSPTPTKPVAKPPVTSKGDTGTGEPSKFIKAAFWVVQNEAKKIGTPCNYYVMRVLVVAGFSKDSFVANDFDIYAKRNFVHYRASDFVTVNLTAERSRLKNYIWSYPARTPFILQWTRAQGKGHIAIMERIGEQLVIYQASIGRHIARRERTSIDLILNYSKRARLTVYSEFR